MTRLHPAWCGRTHVCSIDRPGGEHRSAPYTVDTEYGRLIITRAQNAAGAARLEIRAAVALPRHDADAREKATRLLCLVHAAIATGAEP
jgi:hypothetical protein